MNRIFVLLLYLVSFGLPILIPNWHGKILVGFGVAWILATRGNQRIHQFLTNRQLQVILSIVTLSFLGLLLSTNTQAGLATIESIAPILVLPLIIFSSETLIHSKEIRNALVSFVAGVIILNLASLIFISYELWDARNLQSNIVLANNSIVQIHPAFVSLYLSFGIFFLIDQYFPLQTANRSKLGWVLFSLVILTTYLVWINSRTGIISFSIAFLFYSFFRFTAKSRIILVAILASFLFVIFVVPFSRDRFFNAPQLALLDGASMNSTDPNLDPLLARKRILECSIELLKGPEFFYGYGTGDFRDVLRECYKEKNYTALFEEGLDSHNEYLAQMHRHGIIGLLLFVALLIIPFRYALKYRSPLLAVFIILFAITALFENVFSAQKGVTFFALFCPLLMLYARRNFESNGSMKEAI